jgi:hypothetical protein
MSVQVEGQNDPFSVFEVRSSSLNTYRALKAQLQLIERRFGGLRHVPLKLALWQASNEASHFEPFSLMRLELDASSEVEAMKVVKEKRQELADAGINDAVDEGGDESDVESDAESFLAATLEYPAVQDFFAGAARRPGAEGVTPRSVARHAPVGGLGAIATAAIENAVRASGAGPAEAAP